MDERTKELIELAYVLGSHHATLGTIRGDFLYAIRIMQLLGDKTGRLQRNLKRLDESGAGIAQALDKFYQDGNLDLEKMEDFISSCVEAYAAKDLPMEKAN